MKKIIDIEGMHCGHCSSSVKKALEKLEGVSATVSHETKSAIIEMSVEHSDGVLKKSITDAGFEAISIRTE